MTAVVPVCAGRYVAVLISLALLALTLPAVAHAAGGSGGTSFMPGGSALANGPAKKVGKHGKAAGDSRHLGDRVLRSGMKGHDVRVLQAYLTFAGFGTVVDGSFGSATHQSVIAFESQQGVAPDGIVSVGLSERLRQVVAQVAAAPPTGKTRINADGTATAPSGANTVVQQVIAGANSIIATSYCYGGGHSSFVSSCYDCSGAVSFALHAGGLLGTPMDSVDLEKYGAPGPGQYITIYADSSHAFLTVDGRAFNTANFGGPNIPSGSGPRWRSDPLGNLADGGNYVVRHPIGE